ncbi:MAG: efflux RND transporter periplasmic adaptor subunit [Planctomycetota bacterium]
MTDRRNLRIAFVLVAIALVVVLPRMVDASAEAQGGDEAPRTALPVAVETARTETSFQTRRVYTGRIDARRVARVAFERVGLLESVAVDEGSPVVAKQELARLDMRGLQYDRKSAEAELAGAQAKLLEMRNGTRKETIQGARKVVADLKAQVDLAERKNKRRLELRDSSNRALSIEEIEESQFQLASVRAQYERAKITLEELENGTRVEQIAAQEALVQRLEARVGSIELAITKSTLLAPFDGTVAQRFADEGAVLSPNQPMLELVETGNLEARIGLPPDEAMRLTIGDQVEVTVAGRTLPATLRARHPLIDEATRTQLHIFQLGGAPKHVVKGQVARLELDVRIASEGIWVPHASLVRAPRGLWACYVVENGVVARREVQIVHADGSRVYVRGTLRDGETVISSGAHRVVEGQAVRVEG